MTLTGQLVTSDSSFFQSEQVLSFFSFFLDPWIQQALLAVVRLFYSVDLLLFALILCGQDFGDVISCPYSVLSPPDRLLSKV